MTFALNPRLLVTDPRFQPINATCQKKTRHAPQTFGRLPDSMYVPEKEEIRIFTNSAIIDTKTKSSAILKCMVLGDKLKVAILLAQRGFPMSYHRAREARDNGKRQHLLSRLTVQSEAGEKNEARRLL